MLNTAKATKEPAPVPTAQTIHDALSVSPYMDHVVDAWINAYTALRIAAAIHAYITRDMHPFDVEDGAELVAAHQAFDAIYAEMITRWREYANAHVVAVVAAPPARLKDYGFELCRSDTGDGGWSLHIPGDESVIISGPSTLVDGEWDRPNAEDYDKAISLKSEQQMQAMRKMFANS